MPMYIFVPLDFFFSRLCKAKSLSTTSSYRLPQSGRIKKWQICCRIYSEIDFTLLFFSPLPPLRCQNSMYIEIFRRIVANQNEKVAGVSIGYVTIWKITIPLGVNFYRICARVYVCCFFPICSVINSTSIRVL